MPTITQLEYITAVDKHMHFGRAAQECNVSQPSLSAQIQKAEDELGAPIFDRSKKPILTTDLGQKLVEQARVVLKEHKRLIDIAQTSDEVSGDFHLGVIPTLASYILPLFLENFSRKYPKVNLRINEYKTEEIITMLYDDKLDGALLVTPLYDDRIIERSLFFEPFYAFVSQSHEFSKRKWLRDEELDGETIWLLNEGHCFRDQVIKVCSLKKQDRVLNNVSFESGSLETLKNLIRRGKGYTLLPHLATMNLSKEEKDLYLKRFQKPVPTREVSLVHSRSFLKESIIQALVDEIIADIPKELASLKRGDVEVIDI